MGIAAFVIALLLLSGDIEPTRGWIIALVVLTGVSAMRMRPWRMLELRPALDVRLAAFVLALLLLAGTVDATKDWLIALSAVTGMAAFMPRLFALDGHGDWRDCGPWRAERRHNRREARRAWRRDWREFDRNFDGDAWS